MCGIGGCKRYGDRRIEKYQLDSLLFALEHRGTDAAGVALAARDGKVYIHKSDDRASVFTQSEGYKKFLAEHLTDDIITALVHTRAATGTATPRRNENNHPLFDGITAVIHNGILGNHDSLFSELKLKRTADTDTDILRAIFDQEGFTKKGFRMLNKISGSAAIAAVSVEHPGWLVLGKSSNPIELASTPDMLFWASTKSAMYKALRPWVRRFGLPFQTTKLDVAFMTMPADTIYLFTDKGMEWHQEFKTSFYTSTPNRNFETSYRNRQHGWSSAHLAEQVDAIKLADAKNGGAYIYCDGCKSACYVPPTLIELPINRLVCTECKKSFGQVKITTKLLKG